MVHLDPRDERGAVLILEMGMRLGAQRRPHDLGRCTASPPSAAHPDTFAYRLTTTPQTHIQYKHTVPTALCGYNYISRDLRYRGSVVGLLF